MNESNRGDWLQDTTSAMCLARLRRDGFVSLDADRDGGELVTEPLLVESDSLQLNLVVHDGGHARVEVLNENNEAVPGFGLDDSVPLHGDAIDQDVAWKAGGDVKELAGKAIRLRIRLTDADLYSFQFTDKN